MPCPKRPKAQSGQNLVEMVFTFPLALAMMFFTVDIGRAWFTYQSAKMAANAGAHTVPGDVIEVGGRADGDAVRAALCTGWGSE